MTITLKKALKAKKELEALMNGINLPIAAKLSVFVDSTLTAPLAAVAEETAKLEERVAEKLRASQILSGLRKAIGKANAESGVEDLLAEQANIDRALALWKVVAGAEPTAAEAVLKGELALAVKLLDKEAPTSRIGYHQSGPEKSIGVSTVSEDLKAKAEAQILLLRRQKEDVEDKRVAINAGTHIEIAEDDFNFLRERGIV